MTEIRINTIPLEFKPDKTLVEIPKEIVLSQCKFIEDFKDRVGYGLNLSVKTLVNDSTYEEPTIEKLLLTNMILKDMIPIRRTKLSDCVIYSMNAFYHEFDSILLHLIECGEISMRSNYHASIAPRNNIFIYLITGETKILLHDTVHGVSLLVQVLVNLIQELDDIISYKLDKIIQCYTKEQTYIREGIEYLFNNATFLSKYKPYLNKLEFFCLED